MPRWPKMRSFKQARAFVRKLKISHFSEWRKYSLSGKRPPDIPGAPWVTYKNEWISYKDYFGHQYQTRNFNKNPPKRHFNLKEKWLPYTEARKWARKCGFTSSAQWFNKDKPCNIPTQPHATYKHHGWRGWDDWLGYAGKKKRKKDWLSFKDARKFVHTLDLPCIASWKRYSTTQRPNNIPSNPQLTYEDEWVSWTDWLDLPIEIDKTHYVQKRYLPFEEARALVIKMGLTSSMQWHEKKTRKHRPDGVPSMPHRVYRKEWKGWRYWIGLED